MPDPAFAATPGFDRPALTITTWPAPGGGFDVWFDDLALDADGPDLETALDELVLEVRILTERWLSDDRFRRAPNWARRGPLLAWLATLSDVQIRDRFVLRDGGDGPAGHPLDG